MHAPACFQDGAVRDSKELRAKGAHARRMAAAITDTQARAALQAYADELEQDGV
jgi:hypothetical protein